MNRMLSIAPMLKWTDRHFRVLMRLVSPDVLLYTEMITSNALVKGNANHLLRFSPCEHPLALQLGGSDPKELALSARVGVDHGYDEINLNVGCPSDRVQSGRFGVCLMQEPVRVAACVTAIKQAVPGVPVTVKTRIGVDHQDDYPFLHRFAQAVVDVGCDALSIHARKAWLEGLSPKQNRSIPPLNYERVYELKNNFPNIPIILNGGIQSVDVAKIALTILDGVMIGRKAYEDPGWIQHLEAALDPRYSSAGFKDDKELVRLFLPYVQAQLDAGERLPFLTRHLLGLFQGQPSARAWRRHLTLHAHKPGAGCEVIEQALMAMAST